MDGICELDDEQKNKYYCFSHEMYTAFFSRRSRRSPLLPCSVSLSTIVLLYSSTLQVETAVTLSTLYILSMYIEYYSVRCTPSTVPGTWAVQLYS
jgi:hypothetical protein